MKEYKAFIFDFDGTLMDTFPGVYACMEATHKELGMPTPDVETILKFIGPPGSDWFAFTYNWDLERAEAANAIFKRLFEVEKHCLNAIPYPGMVELLQALKDAGKFTATATNKYLNQAEEMIDHFEWNKYFNKIGAAQVGVPMTKADIICQMAELAGAAKEETLMIGDSKYDAIAAQTAGVDFLGVLYGFGFKSEEDIDQYSNVGKVKSVAEIKEFIGV
ncbi:MAG: HAD hydrolase-like protein [Clostridia bacterium]|nr:HAD hydrolase-like protein [Clostridia bacterium]